MSKSKKLRASGGSVSEHIAPKRQNEDPHPDAENATRVAARLPLARGLPLPIQLGGGEHAMVRDRFRSFGINE